MWVTGQPQTQSALHKQIKVCVTYSTADWKGSNVSVDIMDNI
jgi:hypothetical protein